MRPVDADALTIGKHAHIIPVDLVISKRRPAVDARLLDELLEGPTSRRGKQLVARVRVVEGDLARRLGLLLEEGGLLPVAGELGVVPVEIADAVRRLDVAVPPQVLLDGGGGRACVIRGLCGAGVAATASASPSTLRL